MQFFAIIPAILAVAASAAPTAREETTNLVADVKAHAESAVAQLEAAGCDKLKCISWLASDTAACAAAAAEGGLNPIADIGCFGSVGLTVDYAPCKGCLHH